MLPAIHRAAAMQRANETMYQALALRRPHDACRNVSLTFVTSASSVTSSITAADGTPLLVRRWAARATRGRRCCWSTGWPSTPGGTTHRPAARRRWDRRHRVRSSRSRRIGWSPRGRRALDGLSRRHRRAARGRPRRGGWATGCPVRPLVRWPDLHRLRAVGSARAGLPRAVSARARRRVAALAAHHRPADRPNLAHARVQERVEPGRALPRSGGRAVGAAGPWLSGADDDTIGGVRVLGAGACPGEAGDIGRSDARVPRLGRSPRSAGRPSRSRGCRASPGACIRGFGTRRSTSRRVRRSSPTSSRGCTRRSTGARLLRSLTPWSNWLRR